MVAKMYDLTGACVYMTVLVQRLPDTELVSLAEGTRSVTTDHNQEKDDW
jgi:hypothetical protein